MDIKAGYILTIKTKRAPKTVVATRRSVDRNGETSGAWDTTGRFWPIAKIASAQAA